MTIIGDSTRFAIRYELGERPGGVWLFGKICFLVGSQQVGDYDLGTSLRDVLFQLEEIVKYRGRREHAGLYGEPLSEVVAVMDQVFYGQPPPALEQRALDEQWANHDVIPPVDVFDDWRLYLIEHGDSGRLIYADVRVGLVGETMLRSGEFDDVLMKTCTELATLYEQARALGE